MKKVDRWIESSVVWGVVLAVLVGGTAEVLYRLKQFLFASREGLE